MHDTGDARPANKLLTESGKRSVLKRSRPTESPRKMSYLALDCRTAKPPFVGQIPPAAPSSFSNEFRSASHLFEQEVVGYISPSAMFHIGAAIPRMAQSEFHLQFSGRLLLCNSLILKP